VFEADTAMKMFMHHVQTPPTPPSQRTELPIPRALDDLVLACLDKNPDRRPQDAQELLRLTRGIRAAEEWNDERAKSWWETYLLDLTGPLTLTDPSTDVEAHLVVAQ
jgi:serine/threonine-protein kinase